MNKQILVQKEIILLISILLYSHINLLSQILLSFPGAEGFGKYSKGGRGGEIILVTNLNDDGPGSLRNAMEAEEPRIVLFKTHGTVQLESPIIIKTPFLTVAGQTSPNDGITIRGNNITIATHDVVLRFLRIRVGDKINNNSIKWENLDGISIGDSISEVYNVIIDHCSISWAIDENIGIAYSANNITIQNSIISEGLSENNHPKGEHSKGILVGHDAKRISMLNNFFIHNNRRNPRLSNQGLADIRNNIIFNPGDMGIHLWNSIGKTQNVNIIRNIFISGPDTKFEKEISIWEPDIYRGKVFLSENLGFNGIENYNNWRMVENADWPRTALKQEHIIKIKSSKEFSNNTSHTKTYDEMFNFLNEHVGASLPSRDPIDKRLIVELQTKTGNIINSQEEVGGWMNSTETIIFNNLEDYSTLRDDNENGIIDGWESRFQIYSQNLKNDFDNDGYTNIEEYLNGTDPLSAQKNHSDIYSSWSTKKVPAFPGAEGFGKYAKGGRGGKVFIVTNLYDRGPGSLREALEAEGPRIVVMAVSGLIDLSDPINITNPSITIAGQTAPDGGITIRGNKIHVMASEVIIRFLKVRVGDIDFGNDNQWNDLDAITIGSKDTSIHNIMLDHCSLSWATDENIGIANEVSNVTIQNSIISEGLYENKHPKGVHSMGIIVGWQSENISVINNLFIHNNKRHPRLGNSGLVDVRNNIIYNPGYMGINIWNVEGKPQKANIINNIFYKGPDTEFDNEISIWDPPKHKGLLFLKDNFGFDGNNKDNWDMVENEIYPREDAKLIDIERIRVDSEFPHEETRTKTYDEMITFADEFIGASLPMRDLIDLRLLDEFNRRSGKIIDSQEEVGGWVIYDKISQHSSDQFEYNLMNDIDRNGIKDSWITKYNIQNSEENKDYNLNGYTNFEEYLNGTNPLVYYENKPQEIFNYWRQSSHNDPESFTLENFPNPFRDFTIIRFSVQEKSDVKLVMMNSLGQMIDEIINTNMFPGSYETIWEPDDLPSGTYLMFLIVSDMVKYQKIIHY